MTNELDNILISYDQPDFQDKLFELFVSTAGLSHFGIGPKHIKNYKKVMEILSNVAEKEDEAVSKYTKKFDGVKLTPDQFQITEAELKKAHAQIDKELLSSIRKAIANVREYQTKILNNTVLVEVQNLEVSAVQLLALLLNSFRFAA